MGKKFKHLPRSIFYFHSSLRRHCSKSLLRKKGVHQGRDSNQRNNGIKNCQKVKMDSSSLIDLRAQGGGLGKEDPRKDMWRKASKEGRGGQGGRLSTVG